MDKTSPQVITCKGAVFWGPKEGVKVEEIQVDPPQRCEIRVKMMYASVCHTDLLFTNHLNGFPPLYPRVLGHEGAGVVESVGEGVTEVKEGETVMATYLGECGECENCECGETNLCVKYPLTVDGLMLDGTARMSIRGQRLYQMMSCSTWSEYTVVNVNYVVKLDPTMNMAHASFLSCGFSTGYGAAWKESNLGAASSVAVFGLGAVGLGVVEGARQQGASMIIGIDTNEKKREKGEAFGMTHFVNPQHHQNKPISEVVKELTQGMMGVDCSMECTGADHLLNEAIKATKAGRGKTIAIGTSSSERLEIDTRTILSGRTLKGSIFGGIKIKSDLPFIIHKCINQEIQLHPLLTHVIGLEDAGGVFDLCKQSDCVKVLINISN